jgi:nickel-dependent lactate racemase
MPTWCALGLPTTVISDDELRAALADVFRQLGERRKVLAVPPDQTRSASRAGLITRAVADHYGPALTDVLPALGTHAPMTAAEIAAMYPGVPAKLFRVHDWRRDVVTVGTLPAEFVKEVSGGAWDRPWPAQLNRLIWEGGHDLILSIGQVVPHEVAGMANHAKNLFVGCGGTEGIHASHFIGAAYGMERMMGKAATPVRRLLDEALARFCGHLPIVFVLTVVGPARPGEAADAAGMVTRGLFVGSDGECFDRAAALSLAVNVTLLDEPLHTVVAWLDPAEFRSTWLGNKAIYRTRMAIADGGELVVLAPRLEGFGEDATIDRLIRRHGYRGTPATLKAVRDDAELAANLAAAAHLIHGSSEGRFRVTYCTDGVGGNLDQAVIEAVGYNWAPLAVALKRFDPAKMTAGWNLVPNTAGGLSRFYYVPHPALGLWACRGRLSLSG